MLRVPLTISLTVLSAWAQTFERYSIATAIGTGSHGDGGAATQALLDGPYGLAEDAIGNIYISESNAGVIRRVRTDGVIERFAGTGIIADGAQGRAALETDLRTPALLLMDRDGGLIFTDSAACRIRKVDTNGTIRDLVGTGRCAGTATGPGGGGGSLTRDRQPLEFDLGTVGGMTLDASGRLVFSDESGNMVRRLDSDGVLRVIAGIGIAGVVGDGGLATDAQFRAPRGLAYDSEGNLYIADSGNCRVPRVDTSGKLDNYAGTGACVTTSTSKGAEAARTPLGTLTSLAVDRITGNLLVGSPGQARVYRVEFESRWIWPFLGNGNRGATETQAPLEYSIDSPSAILTARNGDTIITDSTFFTVLRVSRSNTVSKFAGRAPQLDAYPVPREAPLLRPRGLCFGPQGNLLVADAGTERILSFTVPAQLKSIAGARYPTGYSSGDGGPATAALLSDLKRVACAPNGDIYIINGSRVRAIDSAGIIRNISPVVTSGNTVTGLTAPSGLAIDSQGRVLVSDQDAHRVVRYDPSTRGTVIIAGTGSPGFTGDGGAATSARLNGPADLAFDTQGNLLIADRENRRVRRVAPDGTIQTVAGSEQGFWRLDTSGQRATEIGLDRIDGLAVDTNGNIFISEYSRVSIVRPDGRIYILMGFASEDDAGRKSYIGGPLNGCDGLAADAQGRLFFSERQGGVVRVATPPGVAPIQTGVPPSIQPGGIVSSIDFGGFTATAPGSWIEIYGSNLASATRQWTPSDFQNGVAPVSLEGTSVTIAGQPGYVSYVSPNQVNVQTPSNLPSGTVDLTVTTSAGTSAPYRLTVNPVQSGLLAPASFSIGGRQYAAAILPDGTVSASVRAGDTITLYGIGFGNVTPRVDAGRAPTGTTALDLPIEFSFGGVPGTLRYAGLAPNYLGLYQFNVVVPTVPAGDVALRFTLGGVQAQQTLYLAVRP